MFTSTAATAAATSSYEQLATSLVAAIAADAKSVYAISRDAKIKYEDLLQFLGGDTTGPFAKAQSTCTLEWAAQVMLGLTDPTPFTLALGNEMSPTSASLTGGTHDVAYAGVTFNLVNGSAPKTYSVVTGTLPTGLSLNASTGALTGTPTVAATSNFTIEGVDSNNVKARRAYSLVVA